LTDKNVAGLKVKHDSNNVCTVYLDEIKEGWEQWVLITSDRHHDNKYGDRAFEKYHLDMALDRNALIVDVGDLFDAMQGKFDPRRSYSELRPEYALDRYLDEIVTDASRFYAPYANNFLVIGRGNHESSVLKNNSTDLISNLVYRLNSDNKACIQAGGYGGWVRFMFTANKTKRSSIRMKYFHGSGGGGPVTRGVIQTNRMAVYLPDADIIVSGHTHDSWHVPIARERISNAGKIRKDLQHHIRTATYKKDYRDGSEGWHVERGAAPKPLGAVWIRFYYHNDTIRFDVTQDIK